MKVEVKKINSYFEKNKKRIHFITITSIVLLLTLFYYKSVSATMINLSYASPEHVEQLRQKAITSVDKKLEYLFDGNLDRINAIVKYSKKYKIPVLFTAAVIFAESSNKRMATSRVNARGLMQLMKPTAILLANAYVNNNLAVKIQKNPAILYNETLNIRLGTAFLRDLRNMHRSWRQTLHAYNVGPYAFKKGRRNFRYVNKIMRFYNDWKSLDLNKIHKKYGYYLSGIYQKRMDMIVMR